VFKEILKLDFLKNTKTNSLPLIFNRVEIDGFKNKCHEFLQNPKNLEKYLPTYENTPAKQIIKQVHFEPFNVDVTDVDNTQYKIGSIEKVQVVVLFDYKIENKALEDCKYYKVNFDE